MVESYIGEIRRVAFNFAPVGWALCNGQTLPIADNEALFALIGTTYGGDGVTTFALPNLQGRAAVSQGIGHQLGLTGGEDHHVLTQNEMPVHTHGAQVSSGAATASSPQGGYWAATAQPGYGTGPEVNMAGSAVQASGAGLPHENRPPFQVVNHIICLWGIFPSRN